jgi:hypothetical protein
MNYNNYSNNNNNKTNNNNNNNNNSNISIDFVDRIRVYLIVIIFGYFIIKLIFALFGVYPDKYYNQTITLNSNSSEEINQIINAYVPGVWNSELTDFLIMIIMCVILFFVKFNNIFPFQNANKNINYILWIPFIIGLIIPVIKIILFNKSTIFDNIQVIIIICIGIFMLIYNIFSKQSNIIFYIIYSGIIILITTMLYILRNKGSIFTNILYNVRNKNSENCTRYDMENITVKSSAEEFRINIAFITWLILMIFVYNDGVVPNVLNGFLLGIFVGSISFFGMEYPIIKTASDFCITPEECQQKGIPTNNTTTSTENIDSDMLKKLNSQSTILEGRINTNMWTIISLALILILVLLYLAIKMN